MSAKLSLVRMDNWVGNLSFNLQQVTPGRCIEVIKLCVESASGLAPSDMAVGELSREPGVIYNEMFRLSPRPHILGTTALAGV